MPEQRWRVRMALRVGVTGHRDLSRETEARLRPEARTLLTTIERAAREVAVRARSYYSNEPLLSRAVSPLAEGADRLVAVEPLCLGWSLHRKMVERSWCPVRGGDIDERQGVGPVTALVAIFQLRDRCPVSR